MNLRIIAAAIGMTTLVFAGLTGVGSAATASLAFMALGIALLGGRAVHDRIRDR